jgi:HK97 family phage major capsid protein
MEKDELEKALAELQETLKKANEEKAKALETKAADLAKKQEEITTALKKQIEDLEAKLKKAEELQVTKDEADKKNQKALDDLIAKAAREAVGGEQKETFNDELGKGIKENYEAIKGLKKGQVVGFDVKAVADMTLASSFSTADNSISQLRPGILPLVNRKVHVRQLLPIGTLGKSNFDFVVETAGEGDPATVLEGSTKAQLDLALQEKSVTAEYIAGWLRISRKMLDDVDSLTSFLQMRLLEKYLKVEDSQLLTGNGAAPNISGLITNATASTSAATNDYDQLLDALAQLEGTDYGATGILINPATYYKIAQYKASTSGLYDQPGLVQFINGQLYFDGVPVYKTTAMAAKSYLVGDFQIGAQMLVREQPRVEFFEQDSTNVRENKVTVRVEGRIALPIYYAGAFITGTFASY